MDTPEGQQMKFSTEEIEQARQVATTVVNQVASAALLDELTKAIAVNRRLAERLARYEDAETTPSEEMPAR